MTPPFLSILDFWRAVQGLFQVQNRAETLRVSQTGMIKKKAE
jgi:hypothetical protein